MESLWAKDDSGWHWVDTGDKAPRDSHTAVVTSHCHWRFVSQSVLLGAEPHQVHNLKPCDTCKQRWLAAYQRNHPRAVTGAERWVQNAPGGVWHWAEETNRAARLFIAACGHEDTYAAKRLSYPDGPVCEFCLDAIGAEAEAEEQKQAERDPFQDDLL